MAYRPDYESLILGSLIYFVREGDTVDGITVGPETVVSPAAGKPDVDPATNYPQLGEVRAVKFEPETIQNEKLVIRPNGAPRKEMETVVIADFMDLTLDGAPDLVGEMLFGINKVTAGTPQTPFKNTDRRVRGWLKSVLRRSGIGTDWCLFDIYVEIRLKETPNLEAGKKAFPVLRCQALNSTLDTWERPA